MSALFAVFSASGNLPDNATVHRALDTMRRRGTEVREVVRDAQSVLAVGRYRWEQGSDFSGPVMIAGGPECRTATDATLYYGAELRAQLRRSGTAVAHGVGGELVAAAYRAWADAAIAKLEGEYALVVWNQHLRRVLVARDFSGMRPLYYAVAHDRLVIASTIGGVRAAPGVSAELNLAALAEAASMALASSHETCFREIRSLPAGHTLEYDVHSGRHRLQRIWEAPSFFGEDEPRLPFHEAAAELRALLERATTERLPRQGPIGVTLSGGWDSPAVYATIHSVLASHGEAASRVWPVSISFPEGDSGREDELIRSIAGHYTQSPSWLDIRTIPLLEDLLARLSERDDPFFHPFEAFNRALSRACREAGSTTSFTGVGGDQLFHAEPAFLADLLRRGRVRELVRQCRETGVRSRNDVVRWVLRPLLNPMSQRIIGLLRGGRPPLAYLERRFPPWIRADFVAHHGLLEREHAHAPARHPKMGAEAFERRWMLLHPFYARIFAECASLGLAEGVELRSPLLDGRLVSFASTRPRRERRTGRETKRLLRAAVADILPADVLKPRRVRTGTTTDYFQRSMVEQYARIAAPLFADPVLAQLGIVDRDRLHRAAAGLERGRIQGYEGELVLTLHSEAWVRRHLGLDVPRSAGAGREWQRSVSPTV